MEPERPVEKLLRAYAKKRAEQTGQPDRLHPVTRRLLQDEVKRSFPQSEKKASPSVIFFLPRKVAWGLAVFLVLGLASLLFFEPTKHSMQDVIIAKNEPPTKLELKRKTATAPTSQATPVPPSLASADRGSSMSPDMRSANPDRARTEVDSARSTTEQAKLSLAQAAPSVSKRAYSQQSASAKQSEAPKPPLNSFRVVQTGSEVKILDEDGSVYTGSIQLAESALPKGEPPSGASAPNPTLNRSTVALSRQVSNLSAPQNQLSRNYFLNVAGTNLTLKQGLVFNGTLTEFTEPDARPQLTNISGLPAVNQRTSQFVQLPVLRNSAGLNNSRISGQLRLRDGQTVEVNAQSPNP